MGPVTSLHYTPNANFVNGQYVPAQVGFNLADASSLAAVNSLPACDKALVYLGMGFGVTSTFINAVKPFIGNPKVYGFYLYDDPDPTGHYGPLVTPANLKAESDWIHANDPGAKTFILLMNLGTDTNPSFVYNSANTGIDLFGLDPYPVQTKYNGANYSIIAAYVRAAEASGIPLSQIVPVYQAFGGGGYAAWILPTASQEQQILATWGSLVPQPVFDYAYSWGIQQGDSALVNSPSLQSVFAAHNAVTVQTAATTTTVTSSANPSVFGQSVTFTATVTASTGGMPTGTVQFQIDGTNFGNPVNLSISCTASFSIASLAVGAHSVTAIYSGGGSSFTASTGTLAGDQTVNNNAMRGNGNVIATLNPVTGVLSISGYFDNYAITIQQVSPGVLQVGGAGTLVNHSPNPASFMLSSITEIDVSLQSGNNSVAMNNFSIAGKVSIFAASGSDTFSLSTITANSIDISAAGTGQDIVSLSNTTAGATTLTTGDNASLSLNGVKSTDSVKLTAGKNATVSVSGVTAAGDLDITVGDNTPSVTVKGTSSRNLNIRQAGTTGNPFFDLENDTISNNLNLSAGDGNNMLVLSHVNVAIELLMAFGAGKNTVTADHVTALFGSIDGGPSGNNNYFDEGGNSGFLVIHFVKH